MIPSLVLGLSQALPSNLARWFPTMACLVPTSLQPWRTFSTTRTLQDEIQDSGPQQQLTVNFINRQGKKITVPVMEGQNILQLIIKHKLDIPGFGACEGSLSCSTCHLILEKDVFQKLDPISNDEWDILDLACDFTATSRLACQLHMTKSMDKGTFWFPGGVTDTYKPE